VSVCVAVKCICRLCIVGTSYVYYPEPFFSPSDVFFVWITIVGGRETVLATETTDHLLCFWCTGCFWQCTRAACFLEIDLWHGLRMVRV